MPKNTKNTKHILTLYLDFFHFGNETECEEFKLEARINKC